MSIKNSTDIALHVEFNDYSIEFLNFNNFDDAKYYYLNNLSQLKLLEIMYRDENNKYITVDSSYIYR